MKNKFVAVILLLSLFTSILTITTQVSPVAAQNEDVRLYIDPPLVEKYPSDVCTYFNVTVMIENVTDLFGFDINITYTYDPLNRLITFNHCYYNETLDAIWGAGNWFLAMNETGPGWYKLVAVSTSTGFTLDPGGQALFHLECHVEDAPPGEASIHFQVAKLSNPQWESIPVETIDGTYRMITELLKPDLEIIPSEITCRKYCENFTVQINVTHAVDVHDFHFKIMYNTTLLDYVSVEWGQLGPGTITVYETVGLLEGQIVPADPWLVVNGNQTLLNITFHAAYYHVWKDMTACADWMNDLHGKIWFHWAQLTYLEGEPLTYEEDGPLKEIDVYNAWYTFMPIQGDINNDGTVDILDISLVAWYYEQAYPAYDLNCDGIVDIFDLVIIAANLWYEYDC